MILNGPAKVVGVCRHCKMAVIQRVAVRSGPEEPLLGMFVHTLRGRLSAVKKSSEDMNESFLKIFPVKGLKLTLKIYVLFFNLSA